MTIKAKAWAIVSPKGKVVDVASNPAWAWNNAEWKSRRHDIRRMKKLGYRLIRVTVSA